MFMNAYDVQVVDEDGKLTLDQPKNRAGLVKALADYAAIVKKGCSPASSVNWTDVDNNLNFANKTTVMTHNATISIPAAQFDAMNRATSTPEQKATARTNYYEKIRTRGFPDKATGGSLPQLAAVKTAVVFADAKNKARGKEFLAFLLEEDNLQPFVEGSLGRWVPVTKRASVAPFWTDGKDPHRKAVQQQVSQGHRVLPVRLQLEVHRGERRECLGPSNGAHRQGRRPAGEGGRRDDREDQADTRAVGVLRTEVPRD